MRKLFIYGPQGSGKTTIAYLLKEARGSEGLITSPGKYQHELLHRLNFMDLHEQTIIIDEVRSDEVNEVVLYIDGWAAGAKFKGLIIVCCQELIPLSKDWRTHATAAIKAPEPII